MAHAQPWLRPQLLPAALASAVLAWMLPAVLSARCDLGAGGGALRVNDTTGDFDVITGHYVFLE